MKIVIRSTLIAFLISLTLTNVGCDKVKETIGPLLQTVLGGSIAGSGIKTSIDNNGKDLSDGTGGTGTTGAQLFDAMDTVVNLGSNLMDENPSTPPADTSSLDTSDFTRTQLSSISSKAMDKNAENEAIICIPGFSGSASDWDKMVEHLKSEGFANCHAVTFETRGLGKSLEDYAAILKDKIKELQGGKIDTVYLIGHSTGGLIAREFARQSKVMGDYEVPTIVTLGTPHHGTYFLTGSQNANSPMTARKQMHPDSEYLRDLNDQGIPSGTSLFSWWCEGDGIIIPNESSVVTGAANYRIKGVFTCAHILLLQNEHALKGTADILSAAPPGTTGPQECVKAKAKVVEVAAKGCSRRRFFLPSADSN